MLKTNHKPSRAKEPSTRTPKHSKRCIPRSLTTTITRHNTTSKSSHRHTPLNRKRWAVTWGLSTINGLGRETDVVYDPHPQRVILPTLQGDSYSPYEREFDLIDNMPEEGIADVAQVAAGWSTNMAMTQEGRVFQWGFRAPTRSMVKRAAHNSSLGVKLGNFFEHTIGYHPWSGGSYKPVRIPCFGAETDAQLKEEAGLAKMVLPDWMTAQRMRPIKISTASDNRGVLTAGGHLFTWSEVGDIHGSIGQGREYSTSPQPKMIPIPDIIDFSFGYNHLSFITAHGTLYSCGNTDGGATGLPMAYVNLNKKKKRIFRPVSVHTNYEKFMADVREATRVHTVSSSNAPEKAGQSKSRDALSDGNDVHYNIKLGRTTNTIDLSALNPSAGFVPKTVSPGGFGRSARQNDSHEEMRLTGHELLANIVQFVNWRGVEGKEGSCDPVNALATNAIPATLPRFKSVSSGFAHTLVIDEDGAVWSHGRNAHGELGHTLNPHNDDGKGNIKSHITNEGLTPVDFRTHYYPTKIKLLAHLKAEKVSAGLHHSAILTANGEVYTFGNNSFGQCGRLNELPSTLRSLTFGHKQPWALPPGKLYISPNVLNGSRVVDVVCGFYDTEITLSDGRSLMAGGYFTREGHPRSLFSLAEFDPIVKSADGAQHGGDDDVDESSGEYESSSEDHTNNDDLTTHAANTWIQSIPSRDLIPASMYTTMLNRELEKVSSGLRNQLTTTSDQSYFMTSMRFGWQHGVATAIPRSHTDSHLSAAVSSSSSSSSSEPSSSSTAHEQHCDDVKFAVDDGVENTTTNLRPGHDYHEVDLALLFNDDAKRHQDVFESTYTSGTFDSVADSNPFKSQQPQYVQEDKDVIDAVGENNVAPSTPKNSNEPKQ